MMGQSEMGKADQVEMAAAAADQKKGRQNKVK